MWCCPVGGGATPRGPAAKATELQRTRPHDWYLTDIERSICGVWRVCRRQHRRLPPEFRQELRERRRPNAADAADRRKVVRDDQDLPHVDSRPAWRANTFCSKRAILRTEGPNHPAGASIPADLARRSAGESGRERMAPRHRAQGQRSWPSSPACHRAVEAVRIEGFPPPTASGAGARPPDIGRWAHVGEPGIVASDRQAPCLMLPY